MAQSPSRRGSAHCSNASSFHPRDARCKAMSLYRVSLLTAHWAGPDGPARTRSVVHHGAPLNSASDRMPLSRARDRTCILHCRLIFRPIVSAVIAYLLRGLGHVRARRRSRPLPSDDVRRSGGGHTPIPGHLRRREFLNQPVCLVEWPTGRLRGIAACSRVHVIPVRCCTPPASPDHYLVRQHARQPILTNASYNQWQS